MGCCGGKEVDDNGVAIAEASLEDMETRKFGGTPHFKRRTWSLANLGGQITRAVHQKSAKLSGALDEAFSNEMELDDSEGFRTRGKSTLMSGDSERGWDMTPLGDIDAQSRASSRDLGDLGDLESVRLDSELASERKSSPLQESPSDRAQPACALAVDEAQVTDLSMHLSHAASEGNRSPHKLLPPPFTNRASSEGNLSPHLPPSPHRPSSPPVPRLASPNSSPHILPPPDPSPPPSPPSDATAATAAATVRPATGPAALPRACDSQAQT